MSKKEKMWTLVMAMVRHCLLGHASMRIETPRISEGLVNVLFGWWPNPRYDEDTDTPSEFYRKVEDVPIAWLPWEFTIYGDRKRTLGGRSKKRYHVESFWKLLPGALEDIKHFDYDEGPDWFSEGVHSIHAMRVMDKKESEIMLTMLTPIGRQLLEADLRAHALYWDTWHRIVNATPEEVCPWLKFFEIVDGLVDAKPSWVMEQFFLVFEGKVDQVDSVFEDVGIAAYTLMKDQLIKDARKGYEQDDVTPEGIMKKWLEGA